MQNKHIRDKYGRFIKGITYSLDTQFKKGLTPWNKGQRGVFTHSDETKKKISSSTLGKAKPWLIGKKLSEETKRKIGLKSLGRKHTEESKKKMSLKSLGRKWSEESKRRFSKNNRGEKANNWKGGQIITPCKMCNKSFLVFPYQIKRKGGKFCSEKCQYKWHGINWKKENSPCWKGGKPHCVNCDKKLGNYGSIRCISCNMKQRWQNKTSREDLIKNILKGLLKRPTSYEKKVIEIIQKNNFPYKYTGNGTFLIGYKNPDFININGEKKLLEIGNEFHHKGNYVEKRQKHFAKYGWTSYFLLDDNLTKGKILEFFKKIT